MQEENPEDWPEKLEHEKHDALLNVHMCSSITQLFL